MRQSRLLPLCWLLPVMVLLSGCVAPQITAQQQPSTSVDAESALAQCQSEVAALAQYDAARYQQQQTALNDLLDRSAHYLLTRPQLGNDMHTVLDSVYQAQLAKRCHQIHIELFHAMVDRADKE